LSANERSSSSRRRVSAKSGRNIQDARKANHRDRYPRDRTGPAATTTAARRSRSRRKPSAAATSATHGNDQQGRSLVGDFVGMCATDRPENISPAKARRKLLREKRHYIWLP